MRANYDTILTTYIGNSIVNYNIINPTNLLYSIGIFLYKSLTLIGLYIIYRLPEKKKSIKERRNIRIDTAFGQQRSWL